MISCSILQKAQTQDCLFFFLTTFNEKQSPYSPSSSKIFFGGGTVVVVVVIAAAAVAGGMAATTGAGAVEAALFAANIELMLTFWNFRVLVRRLLSSCYCNYYCIFA